MRVTEVLQRRSDGDILTISPEVLQLQKRVKSLRVPEIPRDFSKGKTRKGLKKALQGIESCSVKEELESYEYQLADALNCRRELIDEILETEKYLRNISSGQYEKIYKKLKDLETIQEVLNYADKEVIPGIQKVIKALSIAENDITQKIINNIKINFFINFTSLNFFIFHNFIEKIFQYLSYHQLSPQLLDTDLRPFHFQKL